MMNVLDSKDSFTRKASMTNRSLDSVCVLASQAAMADVVSLASAVEVLHSASLVHETWAVDFFSDRRFQQVSGEENM